MAQYKYFQLYKSFLCVCVSLVSQQTDVTVVVCQAIQNMEQDCKLLISADNLALLWIQLMFH